MEGEEGRDPFDSAGSWEEEEEEALVERVRTEDEDEEAEEEASPEKPGDCCFFCFFEGTEEGVPQGGDRAKSSFMLRAIESSSPVKLDLSPLINTLAACLTGLS